MTDDDRRTLRAALHAAIDDVREQWTRGDGDLDAVLTAVLIDEVVRRSFGQMSREELLANVGDHHEFVAAGQN